MILYFANALTAITGFTSSITTSSFPTTAAIATMFLSGPQTKAMVNYELILAKIRTLGDRRHDLV